MAHFIKFDEYNYSCFSLENTRLLITAAAEVDVVCKQLCREVDSHSRANTINRYHASLVRQYPHMLDFEVELPQYGLHLTPWKDWQPDHPPLRWTASNKLKHHRHTEYHQASLKNVLNAIAGLYVVCLYLYNAKVRLKALAPRPCLLSAGQGFVWLYEEMNRVSAITAESANHTRPPQSLNQ